jgi:hypothetical protein
MGLKIRIQIELNPIEIQKALGSFLLRKHQLLTRYRRLVLLNDPFVNF